ncbi:MAG: hypothetical protein HY554_09355 [Elusimicrobia bacterium]|nr:hypothetical protein [Elusimicrobiota bacterium]
MARKSHNDKKSEPKAHKAARPTVAREVAALGRQVAETLRSVAESKELREVGTEISGSLQRVSEKVVQAVKTASKSEKPRAIGGQVGKILETGRKRGMEAGERVRVNLAAGLREIGQELSRLAQRLDE